MTDNERDYNFDHLDSSLILKEVERVWEGSGIIAGTLAPGFKLERTDGGIVQLSDLTGRPVLLHFVSYTSAVTAGNVEPLKKLHSAWRRDVEFIDVLIRQAHPGGNAPVYHSYEQKLDSARQYAEEEGIPYTVVVDDLQGTVHRRYGGFPDSAYLIGADGRVAFYNMWTHAPTLHRALTALQEEKWTGVVLDGVDKTPHVLPALADGWRGLQRGMPQSLIEAEKSLPGSAIGPLVGHYLKPMLRPIALRSEPLPITARVALVLAAGFAIAALVGGLRRRRIGM